MFRDKEDKPIDGWLTVFKSSTDYEADIVKDRLVDAGISAVVLTHRDHAFHLNVGDLAVVRVLVAPEQFEEATTILRSAPLTDQELEEAALGANPIIEEPTDETDNGEQSN